MCRASAHGLCSIVAADDANIQWTRELQTQCVPSRATWTMSIRSVSKTDEGRTGSRAAVGADYDR
jgi:hypothetical protein